MMKTAGVGVHVFKLSKELAEVCEASAEPFPVLFPGASSFSPPAVSVSLASSQLCTPAPVPTAPRGSVPQEPHQEPCHVLLVHTQLTPFAVTTTVVVISAASSSLTNSLKSWMNLLRVSSQEPAVHSLVTSAPAQLRMQAQMS